MSRRRDQRRRQSKQSGAPAATSTTGDGHLKVTVATLPGAGTSAMIDRDVELSRAALLYADTIDIVSPTAQMLDSVVAAARSPEAMRDLLMEAGPGLLEGNTEEQLRTTQALFAEVLSQDFRDRAAQAPEAEGGAEARQLVAALDEILRQASSQTDALAGDLAQQSGLAELQPAIDKGIINIERAGYLGAEDTDEVMIRFVNHLDRLLSDHTTQLLLDDEVAALVRSRDQAPSPFVERNAQEAFVGSGLIARLPTLQSVPVDELLDLRADLDDQRRKYLRAVSTLSGKMTTTAFAHERAAELTHLWLTDVRPTLDELQDLLTEHSLTREVARRFAVDVRGIATATAVGAGGWLSLGVLVDADLISALAGLAPAAGTAATSLAHAAQNHRIGRQKASTQDLFYLVSLQTKVAS